MCVYMNIIMCACVCMCVCACECEYACTCVCVWMCVNMLCVWMCVCMCVYECVWVCVCVCEYVCVCVCIRVCTSTNHRLGWAWVWSPLCPVSSPQTAPLSWSPQWHLARTQSHGGPHLHIIHKTLNRIREGSHVKAMQLLSWKCKSRCP